MGKNLLYRLMARPFQRVSLARVFQPALLSGILLVLLPLTSMQAQWQDYRKRLGDPNLPAFVREICAPRPNVAKVDRLYEQYYRQVLAPLEALHEKEADREAGESEEEFENEYEHLYSTWRSQTLNHITADGYVDFSPEAGQARQELLERVHPELKGATERNSSNWVAADLDEVIKSDNSGKAISWQANVFDFSRSAAFPDVLYAGTESGGLFKSTDAAQHWSQVAKNQNFRWVQAVAAHHGNTDWVRIGVIGKIMYSDDGGSTWAQCAIDPNGNTISADFQTFEILFTGNLDAAHYNLAYAATSDGILRSEDFGKSWKLVLAGRCTALAEHPTNPAKVYALVHDPSTLMTNILFTEDYGANWGLSANSGWFQIPAADQGKINVWGGRLAVSPAAPDRVYVMLNESYSDTAAALKTYGFIGIYRSDDGGYNWTRTTGPIGAPYNQTNRPNLVSWGTFEGPGAPYSYNQVNYLNNAIAVSTLNADHVYVGALAMWESTDGGSTWTVKGGYSSTVPNIHPDIRRLKFRKTSATTEELFWCSDGGIDYSADGSLAAHVARSRGLNATEFWGFDLDARQLVMGGGSYHNGDKFFQSGFSSGNWKQAGGAENATGFVQYGAQSKMWFSDVTPMARVLPDDVDDNIDAPASILDLDAWRPNLSSGYRQNNASRILFDPSNPRILYWGHNGNFCKSEDDGKTARVLYQFSDSTRIEWLEFSPANSQVIYLKLGTTNEMGWSMYRSSDGGHNWTAVLTNQPNNFLFTVYNDNTVYRADETAPTKLFGSGDGGVNWTETIDPALSGLNIMAMTSVPNTAYFLVVATDKGGVFRFSNAGIENVSTGLPPSVEPERLVFHYASKTLVMGTRGLGVWSQSWANDPTLSLHMQVSSDYDRNYCIGEPIHFYNRSDNTDDSDYSWVFSGGDPFTSSEENPVITYEMPGTWPVLLNLTDNVSGLSGAFGTYVTVVDKSGLPRQEDFEAGVVSDSWLLFDANGNGNNWQVATNAGGFGNSPKSLFFDNYNNDEKGAGDEFRPFRVNLSNATFADLSFDVAYTQYADEPGNHDSLAVLVSADCGNSFTRIFLDGGLSLATAPPLNPPFVPTANQWKTVVLNLGPYLGKENVLFVFRNIGHFGNNLYVDNIRVNGDLVSTQNQLLEQSLIVSPNPSAGAFRVRFDLPQSMRGSLSLTDPLGRELYRAPVEAAAGKFDRSFQVADLASGMYLLRIEGEGIDFSHKIMIQR